MSYGKAIAVAIFALVSQPALAQGPFDVAAIDDAVLAGEHGRYRPSALLTINQLKRFQDDTARRDFGLTSSIGSIIMDNWWAANGALLIGAGRMSVR